MTTSGSGWHGTTARASIKTAAHSSPRPSNASYPYHICHSLPRRISRVEVQAEQAVAIDVEYVHVRLIGQDSLYTKFQLPAEVCLVDSKGSSLVLTKIDAVSEIKGIDENELSHDGGLSFEDINAKPLLSDVRRLLLEHMNGRLVIGHNLAKDLIALGITENMVPPSQRRDTMSFAALQNEKGCGRSLAELAALKLGRKIQTGNRHLAEEDAKATMELYLGWCHFDERLMSYEDLVDYQVSQLLAGQAEGSP